MEEKKKFNTSEVVLGSIITLLVDLTALVFDFLSPFTAGITMVFGIILQSIISFATSWWLMSKGGKRAWRIERQLIKQLSNFLPVIPTAFTAFIIEVVLHNRGIKQEEVKSRKSKDVAKKAKTKKAKKLINALNKKTAAVALLSVISLISFYGVVLAQETSIILTWQANNFYPADYQGKSEAALSSPVSVSATVLENGKFINPSDFEFFWYLDNSLLNRGVGMDEIIFNADKLEGGEYFIRTVMVREGERLEGSITIPAGSRELVIENPRPSNIVKLGERVELEAIPYFFNVNILDELSFFWSVDNVDNENQRTNYLTLDIGNSSSLRGTNISVTGSVINENKPTESAITNLRLRIR